MNLSSTTERTVSPTLRAASVRMNRQVSATPERIFDAWLNADEVRTFLKARVRSIVLHDLADWMLREPHRVVYEAAP